VFTVANAVRTLRSDRANGQGKELRIEDRFGALWFVANDVAKGLEIKKRAERRGGQLLKDMAASGERETRGGGRGAKLPEATLLAAPVKLADLGISKMQSSRWQGLADLPTYEFGATVELNKRGS